MPTAARLATALAWLSLSILAAPPPAGAHLGDLSYSEIRASEDQVFYRLKFAAHLIPGARQDDRLDRRDIISKESEIRRWLFDSITVSAGSRACRPRIDDIIGPDGNDDLIVVLGYECDGAAPPLLVEFHPFDHSVPGYRNIVTIALDEQRVSYVFTLDDPRLTVGESASHGEDGHFGKFFALGVSHILGGYDHLLFLLAVLLVGGGIGRLAGIVTAFTVAHSVTLALAALGIFTLPPRPVEVMIAASIVYVAAENVIRDSADHRWLVTFVFGLIHGFGFAGVLSEAGLEPGRVVVPLLGFNLGVESGQLLVVLGVAAVLRAVMKRLGERRVRSTLSWLVMGAGVVWLIERGVGPLL
jgi:hydrogenase/urease accessory protein HupE